MNSGRNGSGYLHLVWRGIVALVVLVLNLALGWSAASPKSEPDELQVQVGKTIEITSSHRSCWLPTVHQMPTGEILVGMKMSPDEVNPVGSFSAYCISKDGGLTWSRRYTLGAGGNQDGSWSEGPQKDGAIWQLSNWPEPYPEGQALQFRDIMTKFSRGGMEVTQTGDNIIRMLQPIYMSPTWLLDRGKVSEGGLKEEPIVMPWGYIFEALNGDLMTPLYYTAERDHRYYRLALIRSSDGGKTWNEYSTIAAVEPGEKPWPGMGSEGPCEATVVRLADKRLYAIFRTGSDGFIGNAWSSDDGKTWTKPTSTPYKGVALRVRRLSNGVLACTTGRPGPAVVMFSLDGTGEKWSHVTKVFDPGKISLDSEATVGNRSSYYIDFIEVQPGKLLVVYDYMPYGWYEIPFADRESKNVIYGTFVSVRRK